ncbi:FAD/NAD(P)-binding protein [Maribacter litoralis]|uniref:FAD/NAD(P)-binding protein n=1 Tax=Maribacter litoralis TaxID=2059726 RepID=UPI000E316F26|nr:FAD/NAD(P)-binding protein [Maribacter litoralis]
MSIKIAFIGAGIATSYTLIPFLDNFEKEENGATIKLTIIDKSTDFFKGMPYGDRSGKSVLLIQDLKNFITEPHRTHFKNWLDNNITELAKQFSESGGDYATKWVEINKPLYSEGHWDDLYIPRFFFGKYIKQEVQSRIKKLSNINRLHVTYIQKEVLSVSKKSSEFTIAFEDNSEIISEKVILAIGSLPYKKLHKPNLEDNHASLYIKEPYGLGMEQNMEKIASFLHARKELGLPTKIAVLGANASGLEMIYKICDKFPLTEYDTTFKTLSSHGIMPDGFFDEEKAKKFNAVHLQALENEPLLMANQIAEAAHKDIDEAEKLDIGAATTVRIISKGFGSLLPKLSHDELLNFACFHGNQIGRRQRCAGQHYLSVVDELSSLKRFNHIKGRFKDLTNDDNGLSLLYTGNNSTETEEYSESFNIVINCLGSVDLSSEDLSPFLKSLISNGLCEPNPSKIGFKIDENMQASENLYLAGPLLAGNQINDKIFWHLEHCARIIWSSSVLSQKLLKNMN